MMGVRPNLLFSAAQKVSLLTRGAVDGQVYPLPAPGGLPQAGRPVDVPGA